MKTEGSSQRRLSPLCLAWGAVACAHTSVWILFIDLDKPYGVARLQASVGNDAEAVQEVARLRATLRANRGQYFADIAGAKQFVADHAPRLQWSFRCDRDPGAPAS